MAEMVTAPTAPARATTAATVDLARHTARAVDLSALVVVTVLAGLVVTAVGAIDAAAVGPTAGACGGALAAAATVALRDPARDLLAAVPTSPRLRLLQRGTVIIPATLVAALLVGALTQRSVDGPVVVLAGVESVLALVCVGFAASACCSRRWPDAAPSTGAAVALGWSTAFAFLPDRRAWWATLWSTHPWAVIVVAAVVTWIASAERR